MTRYPATFCGTGIGPVGPVRTTGSIAFTDPANQPLASPVAAGDIDSGAAAAGEVLTADGATGASWEAGGGGITLADVYPVGSVYLSVVSTSPATLFGFGTWARIGQGRCLVGVDEGDPDFDTPEEAGGAKTVTLTSAELPSHTHVQDAHSHGVTDPGHIHTTQRYPTATGGSSGFTIDTSMSGTLADNTLPVKSNTTGLTVNNATPTNQATGGGGAHANLQPYLTVYVWKRTA